MPEDPLLTPLRVGTLTLPNRVVMTTVKLGYSTQQSTVNERHIAFYVRRAQGEAGLITSEPLYVQPNGRELPTQLGIHNDEMVVGLKDLADAVHMAGGRIMAHINHAGRAANPRLVQAEQLVSASDVYCPANQVTPRPLTRNEIYDVTAAFASAARRAHMAGFDALEIPFSHGYLIHQFLSAHTNHRTDVYGGSLENRLRFGRELTAAVREQVGDEFPIIIRMNAADYVAGGLTIDDAVQIACTLEEAGANALSVTSGTMCESVPFCLYPTGTPKANLLPMAATIRSAVDLPVLVAGRIRTPKVAREALAAGQADLIGLGRPFLADPDWVRKTAAGDEGAILPCAACHQGCLASLRRGEGTSCVFNPLTGREATVQVTPAAQPRQVMVVGGGPAGLEAAYVAAQRGHQVALYEQTGRWGGQFNLAARAPHKEEFEDVIHYMALVVERAGAEMHLNTRITPEQVAAAQPDAVVLATGGVPLTIPFPGLEQSRWRLAADVLDGSVTVDTQSVLVIGGGLVGLETADYLAAQDKQVTIVEMLDEVGSGMDPLAKAMLLKRLARHQVTIHTGTKILRLLEDEVVADQQGQEIRSPVETVVIAVGVRPARELPDALAGSGLNIHVIGDAKEPRTALEAIHEGLEAGLSV